MTNTTFFEFAEINCELPLWSKTRLCLLELNCDLTPVLIVILISLWEAVRYLFYQRTQCWLVISFSMTALIIFWQARITYLGCWRWKDNRFLQLHPAASQRTLAKTAGTISLTRIDGDKIEYWQSFTLRCSQEILFYLRDELNNFERALLFVAWLTYMTE